MNTSGCDRIKHCIDSLGTERKKVSITSDQ